MATQLPAQLLSVPTMSDDLAQRLFHSAHDIAWAGLLPLALLLIAAAWFDSRQRRIPNALVLTGALAALTLHTVLPAGEGFASQLPGGLGLATSAAGLGLCLLLFFPLFALGFLGAGDVKLMAMVGAFLGPDALPGLAISIALAGGLLSLAVAFRTGMAGATLRNLFGALRWGSVGVISAYAPQEQAPQAGVPYGVAIAAGTVAYLMFALYRAALIF